MALINDVLKALAAWKSLCQARNQVRLEPDRLPVQQLANFRRRFALRERYFLASHLWASGAMAWADALKHAEDAFRSVPV